MKIVYNPKGKSLDISKVNTKDITFDGDNNVIYAQGVTYKGTDTTYSNATQSSDGLLSKEDKVVLDSLKAIIEKSSIIKVSTDWDSTAISLADVETGTYVLQLYIDSNAADIYDTYYTGTFTWYNKGVSETEQDDEIPLQTIGKKQLNQIYLRTYCKANAKVDLQISAAKDFTGAASLKFKFKKII